MTVSYRTRTVDEVDIFYREAGPPDAPVILLLHGFPTAGHMFRDLIPLLADRCRVIAPDLPGSGNTVAPPRGRFDYTPTSNAISARIARRCSPPGAATIVISSPPAPRRIGAICRTRRSTCSTPDILRSRRMPKRSQP